MELPSSGSFRLFEERMRDLSSPGDRCLGVRRVGDEEREARYHRAGEETVELRGVNARASPTAENYPQPTDLQRSSLSRNSTQGSPPSAKRLRASQRMAKRTKKAVTALEKPWEAAIR